MVGEQLLGVQKVLLPSLQGNRRSASWLYVFSFCRIFIAGDQLFYQWTGPPIIFIGRGRVVHSCTTYGGKRVALGVSSSTLLRQGLPHSPALVLQNSTQASQKYWDYRCKLNYPAVFMILNLDQGSTQVMWFAGHTLLPHCLLTQSPF